jgi:small subunit ribosomal protein S15
MTSRGICNLIIYSSIFANLDRVVFAAFTRLQPAFAQPITCSPRTSFHSSALTYESARQRESRLQKKTARARREALARERIINAPHPCLGYRPGNEQLWLRSDLCNIILTPEKIQSTPSARLGNQDVVFPANYQYGIGPREKRILMEDLPTVRMQQQTSHLDSLQPESEEEATRAFHVETKSKSQMARLLDLKNADAGGIAFQNRRRIVEAFGEPGKRNDTGRTEVQGTSRFVSQPASVNMHPLVAILTYSIHNLWAHVDYFRRDIHNRRNLQLLLHQRAVLLRYLKRTGRARYNALLPRLGIEPEVVEGEVNLFRSLFSRMDANPNSGKKGRRKLK